MSYTALLIICVSFSQTKKKKKKKEREEKKREIKNKEAPQNFIRFLFLFILADKKNMFLPFKTAVGIRGGGGGWGGGMIHLIDNKVVCELQSKFDLYRVLTIIL